MNKNFLLICLLSILSLYYDVMPMDCLLGLREREEFGIHLMNYLLVLKEFTQEKKAQKGVRKIIQKKESKSESRFYKNNHIYTSSSEDICFKHLIQSEE